MAAEALVRAPRAGDVEAVAAGMRAADVAEVWAAGRRAPRESLERALRLSSHAWALEFDSEIAALFGVAPVSLLAGIGAPWLLGTDAITHAPRAFMRESWRCTAIMRSEYAKLENYVDARNAASLRWLRRLGFTIHDAQPFGPDAQPFHRFTMEA